MTSLNDLSSPIIFAHRGASCYAPENTMAAFEIALQQGADGIELDAKLSKDNQVVVIHDSTLDRTTDGNGLVRKLRLSELKKLDAGAKFSEKFAGERIPALEEVLEHFGNKLVINIELTNYLTPFDSLPKLAAEMVLSHQLQDSVLFSSFYFTNLLRVKRILPQAQVALLAWKGYQGSLARSTISRFVSPDYLHPHLSDTTENFITEQHNLHRRVNVWTVNHAQDMRNLFNWKVDGIFTDDPRLALQTREEKN